MHVEFKSISLSRFRSFNDHKADLDFDRAGCGLYFLKGKNEAQPALGSNGSGKSSIVDALLWCLYGKTVMGLKNPDVIPWVGKGTTTVSIALSIDKKDHVIKRTAGPNLITIDGKEVGQDYVEKLLPIPIEIIRYTIILGQRQLLFFDLAASEKLKIFSECLNLDRWDNRSIHAAMVTGDLEREIVDNETELKRLEMQLVEAKKDLEAFQARKKEWEKERQEALKHHDKDRSNIEGMLHSLQRHHDTSDLALERAEVELRAIDISKLVAEEAKAARLLSVAEHDLEDAIDRELMLRQELERVEQDGVCPTCKQTLQSPRKSRSLIKTIKEVLDSLDIPKRTSDRLKATEAHNTANTALWRAQAEEKDFITSAMTARDDLLRLGRQIAEFQAQIKSLDQRIKEYENQDNPWSEYVQQERKKIAGLELQIEQGTQAKEELVIKAERTRFWIKGFKDIKLYTLTEILQELEITTNAMIETLGLVGWSVKYDIERETKSGTIARGLNVLVCNKKTKKGAKWVAYSGGEAQRLRIIGTEALSVVLLNHIGVTTNLEIYDEPTIGLGKEGISDLVALLAARAKETSKHIWFIDHHVVESNHFVDTVEVVKDDSGSRIA